MQIPYIDQLRGARILPISIVEMCELLGVRYDNEGSYVMSLIQEATMTCEHYLGRSLIQQEWQTQYDQYLPSMVQLRKGPVTQVLKVKIIHQDWSETVLPESMYQLDKLRNRLKLECPVIGMIVQVHYEAGYGAMRVDVPEDIRLGLMAHVEKMFTDRDRDVEMPARTIAAYNDFRLIEGVI